MPEAATDPAPPAPIAGDIVLRAGPAQAVLRPKAGGRVCRLSLARPDGQAVPVLYPYEAEGVDPVNWGKGGIYPLVPYSGRISNARLQGPGGVVELQPHPNALPHSLHGHGHVRPWTALPSTRPDRAELSLATAADAAWPWAIEALASYELQPGALHMEMTLTVGEGGPGPMPAGVGWHPFFLHRPEARLRFAAGTRWRAGPDFVPQAPQAQSAAEQHGTPRPLPEGPITADFSDWHGPFDLELPSGDVLRLEAEAAPHLVLHRTAALNYLCVEPVSHVADGFNLAARGVPGTGTVWLEAGQTLRARLTLALQPEGF